MRRLLAPLSAGVVSIVALGYLFAVNPNVGGHYPICPTQALFGVDCAGCGLTRATYSLLHGDVPAALDHNILVLAVWVGAIAAWGVWLGRCITGRTPVRSPRASKLQSQVVVITILALLVFGVVRNFVPYLGSGLSA